jgi:hypothetical protein
MIRVARLELPEDIVELHPGKGTVGTAGAQYPIHWQR